MATNLEQEPQSSNKWHKIQEIASATNNVVTPGNVMDVASLPMAAFGLPRMNTWAGIGLSMGAFMVDFIDGKVARATNTSSPLGEAVDATTDKIKLGMAVYYMWSRVFAPRSLIAAITVQNAYNAALTLADRKNNVEPAIHPSQYGKKAIFMQQWGLGINVIGTKTEESNLKLGKAIKTAGSILSWTGVGVGIAASVGYTRRYLESQRIKNNQQQTVTSS